MFMSKIVSFIKPALASAGNFILSQAKNVYEAFKESDPKNVATALIWLGSGIVLAFKAVKNFFTGSKKRTDANNDPQSVAEYGLGKKDNNSDSWQSVKDKIKRKINKDQGIRNPKKSVNLSKSAPIVKDAVDAMKIKNGKGDIDECGSDEDVIETYAMAEKIRKARKESAMEKKERRREVRERNKQAGKNLWKARVWTPEPEPIEVRKAKVMKNVKFMTDNYEGFHKKCKTQAEKIWEYDTAEWDPDGTELYDLIHAGQDIEGELNLKYWCDKRTDGPIMLK